MRSRVASARALKSVSMPASGFVNVCALTNIALIL
jgi:hypothetical protein